MPLRAKLTNPAFADLDQRRMASTAASQFKELPEDEPDDVLFNSLYGVRLIELNRPKKLNSLNGSMARKIIPRLLEWQKSQMANIIMLAGAGDKSLCAGGDVAALAQQNKTKEGQQASTDYFALEYRLDHLIATYNRPYISLMDGITMGGGVGLSVHAPFRIATERTVFAMPETTIGFFPDVGGSFFLSRLDGQLGLYLALTSERLNGRQAYLAGVATHYIHSSDLSNVVTRLSELVFDDGASYFARLSLVDATLAEFTQPLPDSSELPPTPHGDLTGKLRSAIDHCFSHDSIEDIISALKREEENKDAAIAEWAQKTLKTLSSRSPTSVQVTLRQIREGRKWSIAETFVREHAMAAQFMRHPDFVEGVTARLISKPPQAPNWKPPHLENVSTQDVDKFFDVDITNALELLNLAPNGKPIDYMQYPYSKLGIGLPNEATIRAAADLKLSDIEAIQGGAKPLPSSGGIVAELSRQYRSSMNGKQGLEEKIQDVLARACGIE